MSPSNKTVEQKLDVVIEDLTDVKVTLARHEVYHETNTESLKEHILRTKINEERLEMLKNEVNSLEKHKEQVVGALKILMVVGAVVAGLHSMGILQKLI